jgi:hypothetical protein
MARKDLWSWQDGSTWTVGARHGDSDGEIWRRPFDREDEARVGAARPNGGGRPGDESATLVTVKTGLG